MKVHRYTMGLVAGALLLSPSIGTAVEPTSGAVGVFTAVAGKVTVTHPGEAHILPVKLHDEVLFKDVIQTERESRTKAFFQDDSVLTVGENSRVEITEYIYNPEANLRRSVVKVVQGQVRALVSKVFKSNSSRFEVHTPSAVAAARGTYFSVWHENGQSGIINIGKSGRVDFTSGGVTVAVDPGQFSMAEHGKVPSIPAWHGLGFDQIIQSEPAEASRQDDNGARLVDRREGKEGTAHHEVTLTKPSSRHSLARAIHAVEDTMLREEAPVGLPTRTLHAKDHAGHLAKAHETLLSLIEHRLEGKHEKGHGKNGDNGQGDGNTYGLNSGSSGNFGTATAVVVSPPAVFTGAGDAVVSSNNSGSGSTSSNSGSGSSGSGSTSSNSGSGSSGSGSTNSNSGPGNGYGN